MTDTDRLDSIRTAYLQTIERCAQDWGDHENFGSPRITRWMFQFCDDDLHLAEKILNNITYFSIENIRAGVERLANIVYQKYASIDRNRIIFVSMGRSHEGSAFILRALRDVIGEDNIKELLELKDLQPGLYDRIVFVDDFSGTGGTIDKWWIMIEPYILPQNVPFSIALLVTNHIAKPKILQITDLITIHELSQNDNVISDDSTKFTDDEKEKIIEYCVRTNCKPQLTKGYGDCGLLIAFKYGCPNNSLPILWFDKEGWEFLFKRSAL